MEDFDKIDEQMQRALDIVENAADITDEQLAELDADKELLQDCRDLHSVKMMAQKQASAIDVDKEYKAFEQRHQPRRKHKMSIWWGIAAAAAAVFIGFIFLQKEQIIDDEQPLMVYEADAELSPITITSKRTGKVAQAITEKQQEYTPAIEDMEIEDVLTVDVPKGGSYTVNLPDGSRVYLYADSRLVFPTRFAGSERAVQLEGEAYFKVAADSDHPFIVNTPTMQTMVLGTEFNVRAYGNAADNVTLITGSVMVNSRQHHAKLNPGEQASINDKGGLSIAQVDIEPYTSWRDGFFYFDNVKLQDIMRAIGRNFNLSVEFRDTSLLDYKIHFVADRTSGIETVINTLNRMSKVHVQQEGSKIVVY